MYLQKKQNILDIPFFNKEYVTKDEEIFVLNDYFSEKNKTYRKTGISIRINDDKDGILLFIITVESMNEIIKRNEENKNMNRYLFFPINISGFNHKNQLKLHLCCLIIDLNEYNIYILDSNGRSGLCGIISGKSIDELIQKYVEDLNIININKRKFTFVHSTIWNTDSYVMNRTINGSTLTQGKCVILTYLLIQYCYLTQLNIKHIYSLFGKLNDHDLNLIINYYMMGIYKLFTITS